MWSLAYAKPTGRAIRSADSYGAGQHGASRGARVHDGTDYKSTPAQQVKSPISANALRPQKTTDSLRGHYISGHEVNSFKPCNQSLVYWHVRAYIMSNHTYGWFHDLTPCFPSDSVCSNQG